MILNDKCVTRQLLAESDGERISKTNQHNTEVKGKRQVGVFF